VVVCWYLVIKRIEKKRDWEIVRMSNTSVVPLGRGCREFVLSLSDERANEVTHSKAAAAATGQRVWNGSYSITSRGPNR
jgi:hypothetical protein